MPAPMNQLPSALLASAFLIVCGGVTVWDIYCAYQLTWEHTVSATIQRWGMVWPILPFVLGILAGHIFWPTIPPAQR